MASLRGIGRRTMRLLTRRSDLDTVIPPEIIDDTFSAVIRGIVSRAEVETCLEIGSSNGGGSTQAFIEGLIDKKGARLACMELSDTRYPQLKAKMAAYPWVYCFNYCSVALHDFARPEEVKEFYDRYPDSPLAAFPLKEVLRWLDQDIRYARERPDRQNGITRIKQELNVNAFDAVLIDGCEFTGSAELDLVYGAKYILLDDTRSFKTYGCKVQLSRDLQYELICEDDFCRNGFAAFRRMT